MTEERHPLDVVPSPSSDEPLLVVEAIDSFYGPVRALSGVSLRLNPGEKVALLGANGAGKTTTLRTLSGMLEARSGQVMLDGDRIDHLPPHGVVAKGLAHLPEGRQLFPGLSVEENLRFGYYPRRKNKAGYQSALEKVFDYFPKLKERRSQASGTLSGGEQQMLGIGRALMSAPRILLVDELSLGLAPIIVDELFAILDEVNREGAAILIVEQFVHLALRHTDRAYVLQKGEIVAEGTSAALLKDDSLVETYLGAGV